MGKKILLVTFSDNADHQDTLFGLYEEMAKTEDVRILCIKKPKVPITDSENVWKVDCPKRPGITKGTFNLHLLSKIIHRIKKEKIDIIYFESLHLWNLPILFFCRKAKRIHVIHDVIPHQNDKQAKMVSIITKIVTKMSDVIILRNKKYVDELIDRYKVDRKKVVYIDLWRRFPEYSKPNRSGKFLFFGRINPYKGADNLLAIAKKCPNNKFLVVGKVEPSMKEIVNELSKLRNVTLNTGYVSDEEMKSAFLDSEWVIVPYNSATQSGVIIDAYKYSKPVIAFDVGAISEQVVDKKTGYLIDKANINSFSTRIANTTKINDKEYARMCKDAYDYGYEKYSAKKSVNKMVKLFEKE